MWFSALKLGLNAATHIYKKKQETKMKMADAQYMHADKMARGEESYQGKLLEARQSDWKDEAVLIILSFAHIGDRLGGLLGRSRISRKDKTIF
tara:strand:+ start:622 stop:900 length:279 start_codon:yes stop_codon:yes gene_type:complete